MGADLPWQRDPVADRHLGPSSTEGEPLHHLLFPSTDRGVILESAIVFPILLAAFVALRREPEWRLLVFGVLVLTAAWFGLRAVH